MPDKVKIPLFSFCTYAFVEAGFEVKFGINLNIDVPFYVQALIVIASIVVAWFVNEELKEATDFDWTPRNVYDKMFNITLYCIGYGTLAASTCSAVYVIFLT